MRFIPALYAASAFSLSPPMGRTLPLSVISPVMAVSQRTGMPLSTETIAVNMLMPADGPSLGIAPSGIWIWISFFLWKSGLMPQLSALARIRPIPVIADSFITSPRWPVSTNSPLPGITAVSMLRVSPPTLVQARPVTMPMASFLLASPLCIFLSDK